MTTREEIYDLKNKRKEAIDAAKDLAQKGEHKSEAYRALKEQIEGYNEALTEKEYLLAEEEKSFGEADAPGGVRAVAHSGDGEGADSCAKAVKAFAQAARDGFRLDKTAGDKLSEGVDADGGYTVPEDIVNRIIRFREAKGSLLDLVQVVPVTTKSGRRTYKKRGQHTGFATVAEAAKMGKTATPQFATLSYEIEKRRGYLPVTNELLEDSDENIAAVATEWLGDEARVTANKEILAEIATNTATNLKDLDGILTAWVKLGSVFRATSKLITNDSGLLWLGLLKDANGRYLLTPDPADPKELRLCVGPHILPVKTFDDETIPCSGTRIPMILGDLREGIVYWDRRSFSVKVNDSGVVGTLNALEQDLTLWIGSMRDDCTKRDEKAFVNGYIDIAAAGASAGSSTGSSAGSDAG